MRTNFKTLGISKELCDLLNENGISEPTPIQEQAIPALLAGRDMIGQAQTGTGKTLAFMLPIMEKIDVESPHIQALIITPTRELAIQITAEAKKLISAKGIKILAAYGGQDVEQQIRKLKGNIHMVIGTPGRLLDHLRRKTIHFGKLNTLVLDEADQMLHMGFLKEVEAIIHQTSKERQTLCFSATMPKEIKSLASRYLKDPEHIRVQSRNITLDEIRQVVIETTDRGKQDALCKAIDEYRPFMAIIFCRTKRRATALNEALRERGYASDELHGDLTQAKREKVMKSFRKMEIQLLVATDVAARGLDIEGLTHVFNYDIAQDAESYVHRIGRTGRAGQTGVAVTFVTPKDYEALRLIEQGIQMTLGRRKTSKEKEDGEKRSNIGEQAKRKGQNSKGLRANKDQRFDREKKTDGRSSDHRKTGKQSRNTVGVKQRSKPKTGSRKSR